MKPNIRIAHFVAEGRYNQTLTDLSGPVPRVIAGYSYPHPPRFGQVEAVGKLSTEERSRCFVRNHRHYTTVNGVCLECLKARGHRPRGRRGSR